jgi:hypothetical protein
MRVSSPDDLPPPYSRSSRSYESPLADVLPGNHEVMIAYYIPYQMFLPTPLFRVPSQNIYITCTVYSTTILWSIII